MQRHLVTGGRHTQRGYGDEQQRAHSDACFGAADDRNNFWRVSAVIA
jgi:hypothetical protein